MILGSRGGINTFRPMSLVVATRCVIRLTREAEINDVVVVVAFAVVTVVVVVAVVTVVAVVASAVVAVFVTAF